MRLGDCTDPVAESSKHDSLPLFTRHRRQRPGSSSSSSRSISRGAAARGPPAAGEKQGITRERGRHLGGAAAGFRSPEEARQRRARVGKRRPEWSETDSISLIHGFPTSVARGGCISWRGRPPGRAEEGGGCGGGLFH